MPKQAEEPKEETQDPNEQTPAKEECFIITPIGANGSETFIKAMGLIDAVIQPVLDEFEMQARPANRMEDLGSINKQLLKRVLEDRLVIANLTGLNPNVMYELAVRHAVRKPVIIMAEIGTNLPFDISDQRTIFFYDTLAGVEQAKKELENKIRFALQDDKPDNPIYSALQSEQLLQQLDPANPLSIILERLDKMESKVFSVSKSSVSRLGNANKSRQPDSDQVQITTIFGSAESSLSLQEVNSVWGAVYATIKKYASDLTALSHGDDHTFETNLLITSRTANLIIDELLLVRGMRTASWRTVL